MLITHVAMIRIAGGAVNGLLSRKSPHYCAFSSPRALRFSAFDIAKGRMPSTSSSRMPKKGRETRFLMGVVDVIGFDRVKNTRANLGLQERFAQFG
jgi:hypothetical protein